MYQAQTHGRGGDRGRSFKELTVQEQNKHTKINYKVVLNNIEYLWHTTVRAVGTWREGYQLGLDKSGKIHGKDEN